MSGVFGMNGNAYGGLQGIYQHQQAIEEQRRREQEEKYGRATLPYFQEDRSNIQSLLAGQSPWQAGAPQAATSQVGRDPYAGGWGSLVQSLQDQAAGRGPSLADQEYRARHQDTVSALTSQGRGGGSAGAGRMSAMMIGQQGQGLAQGAAQARTGEQMAAYGQLGNALSGASGAAFQRDGLQAQLGQQANNLNAQLGQQTNSQNQQAYLNLLGQQLGLSQAQLNALIAQMNAQNNYDIAEMQQPSFWDQLLGAGAAVGAAAAGAP